jgi:hypothetical protein
MKRCCVLVFAVLLSVPLGFAQEAQNGHGRPEPPMLGIHWAKGFAGPRSSANMTWHNGAIMATASAGVIYWGPRPFS